MRGIELVGAADREIASSERLLEVAHVAQRLSVSPEYVRRLIKSRRLAGFRLRERGTWRVAPSALDAYLRSCAEPMSADKSEHTAT